MCISSGANKVQEGGESYRRTKFAGAGGNEKDLSISLEKTLATQLLNKRKRAIIYKAELKINDADKIKKLLDSKKM